MSIAVEHQRVRLAAIINHSQILSLFKLKGKLRTDADSSGGDF
jgi:hypothetical protein